MYEQSVVAVTYSLSQVWLFVTSWTAALQAPLSLIFPRQQYWGGLSFPSPGDLPDPVVEPLSPASPVWRARFLCVFFFFFLYHWATREGFCMCIHTLICHILFIIDYKKLSCHGEQYVLSSIISSYWGDSSYKDKFAPPTLKGMSMFQ